MSERTAEQDNAPIVVDTRRVFPNEVGQIDPDPMKVSPIDRRGLLVGEFYEIHGVCWYVRKVTKHDVMLRRFTGTLLVEKADATAQQIKGAKKHE